MLLSAFELTSTVLSTGELTKCHLSACFTFFFGQDQMVGCVFSSLVASFNILTLLALPRMF